MIVSRAIKNNLGYWRAILVGSVIVIVSWANDNNFVNLRGCYLWTILVGPVIMKSSGLLRIT